MKIKYKLLNKLADNLSNYRTPEYDNILCLNINGKVKSVISTWNNNYIKEVKEKEQSGFISVNELLDKEIGESDFCDIYFCENVNTICIYNHSNDGYIETVHEFFDPSKERTYLVCKDRDSYESVKGFVSQSSKYHKFLKIVNEIIDREIFEKIFDNSKKMENSVSIENEYKKDEKVKLNSKKLDNSALELEQPMYELVENEIER